MTGHDARERILSSLYDAMLDDARWPATSALIDDAVGVTGNALVVVDGPKDNMRVGFVGLYYRGCRREDVEREYLDLYHPIDERIPRLRRRPYGRFMHVREQYPPGRLKRSLAYNECLRRIQYGNSLAVTLEGRHGSHIGWSIGDPVAPSGWSPSQIELLGSLSREIRQFVLVRQELVRAEARSTTVTALLGNPRIGVVHLDRRGQVLAANDRASDILRNGDGMSDRNGVLRARVAEDNRRLASLLAAALPGTAGTATGGSMRIRRGPGLTPIVVYVKPVPVPQPDYGARHVAAQVLLVDPGRPHRLEPGLLASTLGLTRGEAQVAAWLAEGRSVRDMATSTGHTKGAVYWHLKQMYQKLAISRQADLVRLVLSVGDFG